MVINEYDDKTYKINPKTGETVEMMQLLVPIGTITRSPYQQKATQEWLESKKRREEKLRYMNLAKKELGNFYFILADNVFADLKPQTVAKLVMLCTYLWYDDMFRRSQKNTIKKTDLQKILNISKKAAYDFFKEVENRYIVERDGDLYISESAHIFRHKLPDCQGTEFTHYQKAYCNSIRKLYNATSVRKHKQLGYVFRLIPYINLQYNIFCRNPFEQELKEIEPLTVADLCDLVGYDTTQASRLLKELQALTFEHNHEEEFLISYVDNGTNTPYSKRIFVNPNIIYNGSDFRQVKVLGAFCKTKNEKSRHWGNSAKNSKISK